MDGQFVFAAKLPIVQLSGKRIIPPAFLMPNLTIAYSMVKNCIGQLFRYICSFDIGMLDFLLDIFFFISQTQRFNSLAFIFWPIGGFTFLINTALIIKIDDFFKGIKRTIVHIGWCINGITQRRCTEFTFIPFIIGTEI